MDATRLFAWFQQQEPSVLMEVLQNAYHAMTTTQRRDVFGPLITQIPPSPVDGEALHEAIDTFYRNSLAGVYYAPFDINSRNFSHIPEETAEWFEQLGDFLAQSTTLSDQGQHQHAYACFGLLYALIERMERGEEIIFADEAGSWMIPGDEKVHIRAYLHSLAETATPEAFTEAVVPLMRRDSYASFTNKVYTSAMRVANTQQKAHLKEAIARHHIRTKPRS